MLGNIPLGELVGTMIPLPPGCTVTYSVYIDVDKLTNEMVKWYAMIGGYIFEDKWYDTRGREHIVKYVSYGKGKKCHHHQNGSGGTRLHWHGEDAATASVFLIKFFDNITQNNLQQVMERYAQETA
jgi:hypothetical protein